MVKSIILKEWLKTRIAAWIGLALMVALAGYAVMAMNRVATLKGPDHLWLIMLLKDQTFVDVLRYIPLIIGVSVGMAQMLPEMSHRRLKLTLHLPMDINKMIFVMLMVGMVELIIIYGVGMAIVGIYDGTHLHNILTANVLLTMVPWMLAGLMGYLFACAISLESALWRRILLALLGLGAVTIFYIQPVPQAYNAFIPMLVLLIIATMALSWNSIYRFKAGVTE